MNRQRTLVVLEAVALIAAGGILGANARYLVGSIVTGLGGTLVANVTGCFFLGFIVYESQHISILTEHSRLVFSTGFLSSFTTYSTFALETVQSDPVVGVSYVVASYALGFLAVLGGRAMALRLASQSRHVGEQL